MGKDHVVVYRYDLFEERIIPKFGAQWPAVLDVHGQRTEFDFVALKCVMPFDAALFVLLPLIREPVFDLLERSAVDGGCWRGLSGRTRALTGE